MRKGVVAAILAPLLIGIGGGLFGLSQLDLPVQPDMPALDAAPAGFRVVAERSYRDTDEPAAFATRLMEADGDLEALAARLAPAARGWSRQEFGPVETVCHLREVADAVEVHHVMTAFLAADPAGPTRVLEVRSVWAGGADQIDLCSYALNFVDLDDVQWVGAQARESSTSAPSASRSTRSARSISDGS